MRPVFLFLSQKNPWFLLKTGRGDGVTAKINVVTTYRLGKIRVKNKWLSLNY